MRFPKINHLTRAFVSFTITFGIQQLAFGQNNPADSATNMKYLPEITLVGESVKQDVIRLPEIVGTNIYAGKKNALVIMDHLNTVVVNNNMRQIFAKIPGINIWESDGSGIQIGIAARGLSPNRSWEFNIRQNGCDIAADPFGYPEAYYNPPMQAIQRIQVVRGAGALQYGPQFGGMINYIMRDGSEIHKPLQIETQQTVGSFGLMNTFLALGGEKKKLHYYVFFDSRKAEGWRQNSRYKTQTGFVSLTYKLTNKMKVNAEVMRYNMESQQPGGLTDAQFAIDPRFSSRSRNWFGMPWTTASIKYDWEINGKNRLQAKVYGIAGDRSSVGYLSPINIPDTINKTTLNYNSREVAVDLYRNLAFEAGYLHDYRIFKGNQTVSMGVRYFMGNTFRKQKGTATATAGPDFAIEESSFPTDITYRSKNAAIYMENIFRVRKRLLVIPGVRLENIVVSGSGRLSRDNKGNETLMKPENRNRSFLLGGVGVEYHLSHKKHNEIYANITQAYRPILFSNITSPTTDVVNPALKDSKGWNADLGIRGSMDNWFHFDASIYYLKYNDRIGSVTRLSNNVIYKFVTNLGNTHSYGLESLIELDLLEKLAPHFTKKSGTFPLFASYSYNISEYEDYQIISVVNNKETTTNLNGNQVEYAPKHLLRAGLSYKLHKLMLTFQGNHVSEIFSDAGNTKLPSPNAQNGLIPAYTVYDFMAGYTVNSKFALKLSVNNLTNQQYFTRRAGGYPGPGLLPSDGRSILVNLSVTL